MDLFELIRSGNSTDFLSIVNEENLNTKKKDGASFLHVAIAKGQEQIAIRLIELGIDVNSQNADGQTPLH